MTLSLVDLRDGRVVKSYKGCFGPIEWSPDGRQILYLDPYFYLSTVQIEIEDQS